MSKLEIEKERKKERIRYDWKFINSFNDVNLETYVRQQDKEFRTVQRSGIDNRKCN
jgi:hypothetical protein